MRHQSNNLTVSQFCCYEYIGFLIEIRILIKLTDYAPTLSLIAAIIDD